MKVCQECGYELHELEEHVTDFCPECSANLQHEEDFWEDYRDYMSEDDLPQY